MFSQNTDNNIEYRELDLSKVEDLNIFFESAGDVYAEAEQYKNLAESEGYKSLAEDDVSGEEVYITLLQKRNELQDLIKLCRDETIPNGREIEDRQIELMQNIYNDMILLRNHIRDTYENFEATPLPEEKEEPVRLRVADAEQATLKNETQDELSVESSKIINEDKIEEKTPVPPKEPEEEVNDLVENVAEADNDNEETDLDYENLDRLFLPTERELEKVEGKVYEMKRKANSLFAVSERDDEIISELGKLDLNIKRIKDLKERVENSRSIKEDESVLKNNLKRYERVAGEIERNTNNILDSLSRSRSQNDGAKDTSIIKTKENVSSRKSFENYRSQSNKTESDEIIKLTPEIKRKTMEIVSDNEADRSIPISVRSKVAKEAGQRVEKESSIINPGNSKQKNSNFKNDYFSRFKKPLVVSGNNVSDKGSIVAELEKKDVINEAVPGKRPSIVHPKLVHQERSLTRKYLGTEPYLSFIKANYTSLDAFERILDTVVTQIENETLGAFDRWLREESVSPFHFIQDMTINEVEEFSNQSDVREVLSAKNIRYETFIKWIDLISEMQSFVNAEPDMKFGELYARWMIEEQMSYTNQMQEV